MLRQGSLLVAACLLTACADTGDEGFVIINNTASSSCEFTGALDQLFYAGGKLTVFSPGGYFLTPLLQSRITAITDDEQVQRRIDIRGARVDLTVAGSNITDANGGFRAAVTTGVTGDLSHFQYLLSGSLSPGGTMNLGFDVVPAALVTKLYTDNPLAVGDRLHIVLQSSTVIYGDFSGSEVESNAFIYPIEVCNDCNATVLGKCTMNAPPEINVAGNACNAFQDGTIECCTGDVAPLLNKVICPI